jgi:hypothetical protein
MLAMTDMHSINAAAVADENETSVQAILDALYGLRFGSVTVIVQDGVVIQIERIEKKRLRRSPRKD